MFLNSTNITCASEKEAEQMYNLLLPEMQKTERVSSEIERLKNIVVININAKDAVILRSVLNSYMRIISITEKI